MSRSPALPPATLPAYALGLGVTFALSALAGLAFAPGCSARACTSSDPSGDPSPALDCPAGALCYLGECIRSCSAGQELAERCGTGADCPAARPNCVSGFCSSCDPGELCVPTLNVCRAVLEIEEPEPPTMPGMGPRPPSPLDGGPLDGGLYPFPGLRPNRDAGAGEPPPEAEFTVAGHIDLAETVDLRGGANTPVRAAAVRVFDVEGNGPGLKWRADVEPPAVETVLATLGACSLRRLSPGPLATPIPANLGRVTFDDPAEFPGSIAARTEATFVPGSGYVLEPAPGPGPLLTLSGTPRAMDIHYVEVRGDGVSEFTTGTWPAQGGFAGHQIPFRMEPTAATATLLSSPITVTDPPGQDLRFAWARINSGNDPRVRVHVRITGPTAEIFCSATEGEMGMNAIEVRSALLGDFRGEVGPGTYPVVLERASTARVLPVADPGELIDLTVRVRHSLIGELVMQ